MIIDAIAGNCAPDAGSDDDHRLDATDAGRGGSPQIYYTAVLLRLIPVAMIIIAGTGIDAGMIIVTVATMPPGGLFLVEHLLVTFSFR